MRKISKHRAAAMGVLVLTIASIIGIVRSGEYSYLSIVVPMFMYIMMSIRRAKKPLYVNNFNNRMTLLWYICVLCTLILAIRFFNIQVINHNKYKSRANEQARRVNEIKGSRGNIYDSEERVLAYDINEYDFIINPMVVNRSEKAIKALQEINKNYQSLLIKPTKSEIEKLSQAKRGAGYKVVAKNIDEDTKDAILDYLREKKVYVGSALQLKKKTKRGYTENSLGHIVGMVAQTKASEGRKIGVFGLESEYEEYLQGRTMNRKSMFTNAREMKLPTSADQLEVSANGRNIHLTIDSFLQYILSEEIKKKYEETRAQEAVGIIMDPKTGKILATTAYSRKKDMSLRDPIIQNQYEPGSTFKPIIVGAAMEEGAVNTWDTFDVGDGRYKKYGHTIRESSRKTRGVLTLSEVLEKSSNIGMVQISDKLDDKVFEEYLRKFGFGSRSGIDIPGEINPYLPESRRWDGLKKNTMSFGQGIAMTPLQLITAFSATINGGKLYRPYLVEKITDDNDIVIRRNTPFVREQVISPEVSKKVRDILEKVVSKGTGRGGRVEGYEVGGKTGTAQISAPGGYIRSEYLASFIGFLPADDPEYVILTMFLKPQADIYYKKFGGVVAAPVFSNIASRIIKYRDLMPYEMNTLGNKEYKELHKGYMDLVEMPDLVGKSVREAMRIMSRLDVDIKVNGNGTVERQFPKKGTALKNIKEIKLYLE